MNKEQFKNNGTQKFLRIIVGEDDQIYIQNSEFTQLEYIGLLTFLLSKIQDLQIFQNQLDKEMD